ncbi:Gfo/Idh/MocA family protein [Nesterenkonia sphaerica]|uniref:Gfo/Idh/MocA family oxidoreductase n=1 Tax=Nesterenkonia sphaerica TaxID=1804988 RepID=A0A5R9AN49_9MICC|nr:Gfo/Idh/MocA family oxidoreductase [Nesterenkonia sphaerica]TLP79879.1 Gfo/Idh/MocA family oxidoreductase [Nesterenkonia sphaerica]
MRLRAGVIGTGRIGALHAAVYARDARTELVGVVDADSKRAEQVAAELGVAVFRNAEELVEQARPDVVTIAVPEHARLEPSLVVGRAGCHILLEKPLTPSLAQTDDFVDKMAGCAGTIMVNFILRSDPRFLKVQEAVQQGRLGTVRTISAHRRGTAAGVQQLGPWTNLLISTAIHDIDAMAWVIGAPITRVYAEGIGGQSAQWGHEDAVVATLQFANGVIGSLDTSWVLPSSVPAPLDAGFKVIGTGGSATIEGADQGLSFVGECGLQRPDLVHWPSGRDGVGGDLRSSISHFLDCVESGGIPTMTLADARQTEQVVHAIRESIQTRAPITID